MPSALLLFFRDCQYWHMLRCHFPHCPKNANPWQLACCFCVWMCDLYRSVKCDLYCCVCLTCTAAAAVPTPLRLWSICRYSWSPWSVDRPSRPRHHWLSPLPIHPRTPSGGLPALLTPRDTGAQGGGRLGQAGAGQGRESRADWAEWGRAGWGRAGWGRAGQGSVRFPVDLPWVPYHAFTALARACLCCVALKRACACLSCVAAGSGSGSGPPDPWCQDL